VASQSGIGLPTELFHLGGASIDADWKWSQQASR
jgi:hypothetical protein